MHAPGNHALKSVGEKIEAYPILGWLGSALAWVGATVSWVVHNAGTLSTIFGMVATLLGVVAGYYTARIQRRAWKRGETRPPMEVPRRWRPWRKRPRNLD